MRKTRPGGYEGRKEKTMNAIERIKMVKAMEYICRNLNDEEIIEAWLIDGVADGDIWFGDLSPNADDAELLDYYIKDKNFADLMHSFLFCMKKACKSGGLYCDRIVSGT